MNTNNFDFEQITRRQGVYELPQGYELHVAYNGWWVMSSDNIARAPIELPDEVKRAYVAKLQELSVGE